MNYAGKCLLQLSLLNSDQMIFTQTQPQFKIRCLNWSCLLNPIITDQKMRIRNNLFKITREGEGGIRREHIQWKNGCKYYLHSLFLDIIKSLNHMWHCCIWPDMLRIQLWLPLIKVKEPSNLSVLNGCNGRKSNRFGTLDFRVIICFKTRHNADRNMCCGKCLTIL